MPNIPEDDFDDVPTFGHAMLSNNPQTSLFSGEKVRATVGGETTTKAVYNSLISDLIVRYQLTEDVPIPDKHITTNEEAIVYLDRIFSAVKTNKVLSAFQTVTSKMGELERAIHNNHTVLSSLNDHSKKLYAKIDKPIEKATVEIPTTHTPKADVYKRALLKIMGWFSIKASLVDPKQPEGKRLCPGRSSLLPSLADSPCLFDEVVGHILSSPDATTYAQKILEYPLGKSK